MEKKFKSPLHRLHRNVSLRPWTWREIEEEWRLFNGNLICQRLTHLGLLWSTDVLIEHPFLKRVNERFVPDHEESV